MIKKPGGPNKRGMNPMLFDSEAMRKTTEPNQFKNPGDALYAKAQVLKKRKEAKD